MCIIATKPAGVALPSNDTIRQMWQQNPDGAGFMYASGGVVHIRKGFMSLRKFRKALRSIPEVESLPLVMHFRIATSGGINAAMCHPFPLSDKHAQLVASSSTASVGIAHNGVLSVSGTATTSDTYEYIKHQLRPLSRALPRWYENRDALELVEHATAGSRLAILTASGDIVRTGEGWVESGGLSFSNWSFCPNRYASAHYWDWVEDDALDGWADNWSPSSHAKLLQMLYNDTAMVRTSEGELVEGDWYAIDAKGRVYWYEEELEAWAYVPSYTALTAGGGFLQFDETEAVLEYVLD